MIQFVGCKMFSRKLLKIEFANKMDLRISYDSVGVKMKNWLLIWESVLSLKCQHWIISRIEKINDEKTWFYKKKWARHT